MGANFNGIVSWPGSFGPSRGNDTPERFPCLALGTLLAGDSPREAGYDSGIAILAPMGISRP